MKFKDKIKEYNISSSKVEKAIKETNGKIFSVRFRKSNGEIRDMVCRLGVHNYLRGGKDTTSHLPQYINVYDVQKNGYRKINLKTITHLTIDKFKISVKEEI